MFDGERVELVRNAQGSTVTPSVVRIDGRGNVTVGARARRALDQDPTNVQAEFKRLMGTPHALRFAASGATRRPEELSAEVLRSIREDVRAQMGVLPERAVISVPALFELPQTAATSEAARLAGFDRVEMIQEPVASAIASGWKADAAPEPWLVYDLGGGTFDVSLLETQEGLLRVVGHDGDNFLGGRDFDAAIVDWAVGQIADPSGPALSRADSAHAGALRRLRAAAEEAKIELTRSQQAEIAVAALDVGGRSMDVSLVLDRETLERLVEPLLARSLAVCARLLGAHGLVPGPGVLSRVVLVGGPTAMPLLRRRVSEALAAPLAEGVDPMTVVAQGAALYAASAGLDAPTATAAPVPKNAVRVWLQYPAMSSDPNPYVVGRLVDTSHRDLVRHVVVRADDGAWSSAPEPVDGDGTFAVMTQIALRRLTVLSIEGRSEAGAPVPLVPSSFTIVHGVTVGDPPLARSVGVALASDAVQVFFERGSPLPMRRTFPLRTVEALSPRDPEGALRVPIVQGEFPLAHLCRLVGNLEIRARELKAPLAAQSIVDVTIELDRGGRLAASARIHDTAQVFDDVAYLVAGSVPVAEILPRLADLSRRVQLARSRAVELGVGGIIAKLIPGDATLAQARRDEEAARGGDADAAEKVRRTLVDIDALLAEVEAEFAWPDLEARSAYRIGWATSWVAEYGTPEEKKALSGATTAIEKARAARNAREIDRQLHVLSRLGSACYLRSPNAWVHELDYAAGRVPQASDPRRASKLVEEGRAAASRGDEAALQRAVRALWELLPSADEDRALGHGSGVR
jgi:molecular chaperone DnaK